MCVVSLNQARRNFYELRREVPKCTSVIRSLHASMDVPSHWIGTAAILNDQLMACTTAWAPAALELRTKVRTATFPSSVLRFLSVVF